MLVGLIGYRLNNRKQTSSQSLSKRTSSNEK
jgi:hypothetical protein